MDHRTSLATIRTLALRAGTSARRGAGRAATTVAREVGTRISERRATRNGSTPPGWTPPQPERAAPAPAAAEPATRIAAASPADVAQAVARNAAGLARTNPDPQRRPAPRRSAPGAKLPARAGQGILGV